MYKFQTFYKVSYGSLEEKLKIDFYVRYFISE